MTGELLDLGPLDIDEFAEFWAVYPRHKDRARAEVSYRRARRVAPAEVILEAAQRYAAEVAGTPVSEARWAVEWLRAEPWLPDAASVTPLRVPSRRRRRDPSRPRRAPHLTARPALSADEQKAEWCRQHGITVEEYEQRRDDREWIELLKRRGVVA